MTDKRIEFPPDVWIAPTLMEDLRPPKSEMPELTEEWFRVAMQPKYHQDGSVTRTLTPPRRSAGLPVAIILLIVTVLAAAAFVWGLVR